MSQHHRLVHGRVRQRRNAVILNASDVCHICGHPGADEVDHVIPLASANGDRQKLARLEAPDNLRPAHGPTGCPTCGVKCNRVKSDKAFAPVVRRSGSLNRPGPQGASNT